MIGISSNIVIWCTVLFIVLVQSVCIMTNVPDRFVLIRNSSIFVDKTVLLKNIFKYDYLLLTAPHRFGKTTNLQMIKLFLGNDKTKLKVANVFRNTYIWKDREFIVKHMCNYPVIYCSFKPKKDIENYQDFVNELKISVKDAFVQHLYLLKSPEVSAKSRQIFLEYCKVKVNDFELGLKFLSEILHVHHRKKVTLLIDDYDFAIVYSIFKKVLDSTKIAQIIFRVLDNTINLNEFVEKAVIMGRLPFRLGVQYSGLYLLEHFKFLEKKDFTPFFGFTKHETDNLLDKLGLRRYKGDVSKWYGGYSYLNSNFSMYNPWSVLMFIKTKILGIHWITKKTRQMLYAYLEPHYGIKSSLIKLVNNKTITIESVPSFTTFEVDKLKGHHFYSGSYEEDETAIHLFLQFLQESGYLTYAENYRVLPITTKLGFPNLEVQMAFGQILRRLGSLSPDVYRY